MPTLFYVLKSGCYGTLIRFIRDTDGTGLGPMRQRPRPTDPVPTSRTPDAVILRAVNPPIVHMMTALSKPRSPAGRTALKGFSSNVGCSGVKPCSATSAIVPPAADHAWIAELPSPAMAARVRAGCTKPSARFEAETRRTAECALQPFPQSALALPLGQQAPPIHAGKHRPKPGCPIRCPNGDSVSPLPGPREDAQGRGHRSFIRPVPPVQLGNQPKTLVLHHVCNASGMAVGL